jgi:hypothetical protein
MSKAKSTSRAEAVPTVLTREQLEAERAERDGTDGTDGTEQPVAIDAEPPPPPPGSTMPEPAPLATKPAEFPLGVEEWALGRQDGRILLAGFRGYVRATFGAGEKRMRYEWTREFEAWRARPTT